MAGKLGLDSHGPDIRGLDGPGGGRGLERPGEARNTFPPCNNEMSYTTLFCVSCLVPWEATLYRWQTTHKVYSAWCRCGQSDTNQQQREDCEDCEGLHSPPGSGLHTALSVIYKDSELKQVHVSLLHIAQ